MKLFFVTTHLPPDYHYGGVVNSSNAIINGIRHMVSDLTVFCVSKRPSDVEKFQSIDIICAKSLLLNRWGLSFSFPWLFIKKVKQADVVVINGIFSFPVTIAAIICIFLKKHYVINLRGGLLPRAFSIKKSKKKLFYRIFIKPILNNADFVQVTSKTEYQNYLKLKIGTPSVIIPNCISVPDEQLLKTENLNPEILKKIPDNKKIVLFMGRLDPIKGLDRLLDSWYEFKTNRPEDESILIIAGPDERDYKSFLMKKVKTLGLSQEVIFLGMINPDEKWALYCKSDVLVCPSYSENFGIVVAESLVCGTSVIASNTTPWQFVETIGAGKWINADYKSLAMAIKQILSLSNEERKKMGDKGKEYIKSNFSQEKIAKELMDLYCKCL